jgi:hypothetical protein
VTIDNDASGDGGRIIMFRPRTITAAPISTPVSGERSASSPVSDLAKFERTQEQDDYRRRMIVNAVALAFTVVLVGAGIWIAESMATIRKNQDCVLMGRKSCAPVPIPAGDRWSGNVSGQ